MDECQHVWSGDDCCQHCIRCGIGKDIADYEAKIAELTAENGRLRAALREIRDIPDVVLRVVPTDDEIYYADGANSRMEDIREIVDKALAGEEE